MPRLASPILLFDGDCAFCARSVRFVLRHDRVGRLHFAPRQGVTARALEARHPALVGVDALVWVHDVAGTERVLVRSDAALAAARYLGGRWAALAAMLSVVPRGVRDWGYDLFAAQRHRFGGPDLCAALSHDLRARALP